MAVCCRVPPPHLSPFVNHTEEGYVPEYAKVLEQLKEGEEEIAGESSTLPGGDELETANDLKLREEDRAAASKIAEVILFAEMLLML